VSETEKYEIAFTDGLKAIFDQAQRKDEFEFVSVLLGYDGAMGDPRALSHLYESEQIFREFSKMVNDNQDDFISVRIGLFLYCHFFEMSEFYRTIGNLLYISKGDQYRVGLFATTGNNDPLQYPAGKIDALKKVAAETGHLDFMELFDHLFFKNLRNAFFHSDYSIVDGYFYPMGREPIITLPERKYSLEIDSFILPLVNGVIRIALCFFDLLETYRKSYRSVKVVQGRFPNLQPIFIIGDTQKGLIGFETSTGSAVRLQEWDGKPFLTAHNIQINRPRKASPLEKRLDDIVGKNRYASGDTQIAQLVKDILAGGDYKLIKDLSIIYYNWGNNISALAETEPNERKKIAQYKLAITKYDQALVYHTNMATCRYNRALSLLRLQRLTADPAYPSNLIAAELEKVIELHPEIPDPYPPAGEVYYHMGQDEVDNEKSALLFKRAVELFIKSCELNHENENRYFNTALSLSQLVKIYKDNTDENGYLAQARKYYELAINNDPLNTEYLMSYSSMLEERAQVPGIRATELLLEANGLIDKVIAIDPNIPRAWFKKGINFVLLAEEAKEIDQKENYLKEAVANSRVSLRINPMNDKYQNNVAYGLLQLAILYGDDRCEPLLYEAITILQETIKQYTDKKESYANIGACYFELFKLKGKSDYNEKALSYFLQADEMGENATFYLLSYFSVNKNKEQSLTYFTKMMTQQGVTIDLLQQYPDMSFVLSLPEVK